MVGSLLAAPASKPPPQPLEGSPFGPIITETAKHSRHAAPHLNNRVLIVNYGDDALMLRAHLIRKATRSIEIQTFIWTNDETGRFLMRELIDAA